MTVLTCPKCAGRITTDGVTPGSTIGCPHCGANCTTPARRKPAAPRHEPKTPAPVAPAGPTPTKTRVHVDSHSVLSTLLIVFGIMAVASGMLITLGEMNTSQYQPKNSFSHRFQSSNAYGATANAVEHLAETSGGTHLGPFVVVSGLLLCMASYLVRLHTAIDNLSRRL